MKIVVVGGGNSTPIFASLAKLAGHHVSILTRRPTEWSSTRTIGFENQDPLYLNGKEKTEATVDLITSDASQCVPDADMVFLSGVPTYQYPYVLRDSIAPHLDRERKVFVGTICAYGGFNWIAAQALGEGKYSLFGTQVIPFMCGTKKYGHTSLMFGAKRLLRLATESGKDEDGLKQIMGEILRMKFLTDTDFIASTLWPNNPGLHPPILYGLFKDWDGKAPFEASSLPEYVYTEMTDASAKYICDLDEELCSIVAALSKILPHNESLKMNFSMKDCIVENYESQITDPTDMASVIRTNIAYSKHKMPFTDLGDGKVVPTLKHKFFEGDLTGGLCLWKDIADLVGIEIPRTVEIILWNQKLVGKEYLVDGGKGWGKDAGDCLLPSKLGLTAETLEHGIRGLAE